MQSGGGGPGKERRPNLGVALLRQASYSRFSVHPETVNRRK